jgi:DNA-binding response OmpR family regulator
MRATTILLVEDDSLISEVLTSVLEEEGYAVIAAPDGEKAIALLGATRPDLVVLDVMMPVVDGREVLLHIRQSETTREMPVILMSASPLTVVEGMEREYSLFLRKPFDLQTLLDEVARLTPRKHSGEALRGAGPARLSPPS